jgi:hypothetical protein
MNEQGNLISRQEIYDAIWKQPLSKLAPGWNTTPTGIIDACSKMNIPRPGPGHWALVQKGWQIERTPLPTRERETPIGASMTPPMKKKEPKTTETPHEPEKARRIVDIPKDIANAHRFVKQTRKALTTHTYLHNGFVRSRSSLEQPLAVIVSPEQLDRALRICDAIIRGMRLNHYLGYALGLCKSRASGIPR